MQLKNATNRTLGATPTLRVRERVQIKLASVSVGY